MEEGSSMRKYLVLTFILVVFILFVACDANSTKSLTATTTNEKITIGHMEIVTKGETYIPIEHWVHSLENGTAGDGKHFDKMALDMMPDLKVKLEAATPIPYAKDFRFFRVWPGTSDKTEIIVGDFENGISFSIFDGQVNRIASSRLMEIPPDPGLYYVAAEVMWGNDTNNARYQYIFKVEVK
jgi:hypothetical protein